MEVLHRIKEYCKHSTVHGLQYITEDDRHWIERVFWAAAVAISIWGTIIVGTSSYKEFKDNPVSFVVETNYLKWNTSFPAITICEMADEERVWDYVDETGSKVTPNAIGTIESIIYFRNKCELCSSCNKFSPSGTYINCSMVFDDEYFELLFTCEDMIFECFWNNEPFNCCANFLPLINSYGKCYTLNSLHTRDDPNRIELISNRSTGPGTLMLKILDGVEVYMHANSDVVTQMHETSRRWIASYGRSYTIRFQLMEIENDPLLPTIPVEKRGCRFHNEMADKNTTFTTYSYSVCVFQCQIRIMLKYCNCLPHILMTAMVKNVTACDIKGYSCLDSHISKITKVSSKKNEDSEEEEEDNDKGNDNDNDEDECDCTADCNEPDFYVVYETMEVTKSDISNFTLIMNNLPTERLRRYVVRTKLDLVVSLGGIVGLFLGASLISAVEIFVHSFIRVFTKTKPKCPAVHQVGEISVTKPNKKSHDNTNSYSQYINNSLFFKKEYRNATI